MGASAPRNWPKLSRANVTCFALLPGPSCDTCDLGAADASVAMDVLSMIKDSPHLLRLDNCCQIVSCLQLLFVTAHQSYIQTAIETALILTSTFGEVIQQTCRQDVSSVGVDLSFDERKSKCQNARASLKQLCHPLQALVNISDQPQLITSRLLNLLTNL